MKFKRVKLMGKNLDDVRPKILARGMEIVDENFDLVIAHGGDGTLLWSERDYPGIPKLPLRDAYGVQVLIEHYANLPICYHGRRVVSCARQNPQ
ncbi:MAG: hypothetical protein IJ986_03745 [Bacteroidales bacterium]|nr:hypothetical protein [Bacteroidales bacterium]